MPMGPQAHIWVKTLGRQLYLGGYEQVGRAQIVWCRSWSQGASPNV